MNYCSYDTVIMISIQRVCVCTCLLDWKRSIGDFGRYLGLEETVLIMDRLSKELKNSMVLGRNGAHPK